MKKLLSYFSKFEITLWLSSMSLIILSFLIFDRTNFLALIASLIGTTSLIFCAKGNPFGQVLIITFSTLYGVISYSYAYYGEVITYLGMTMPLAVFSLVSWLRNPYKGNKAEVKVGGIGRLEQIFMYLASILVTVLFYFVLKHFGTANILTSTVSITTSFIAAYLTFRRSPYFALAYAVNDVVLIVLWIMASISDIHYISVVVCFVTFLFNDIYSFVSWQSMKKRQNKQ